MFSKLIEIDKRSMKELILSNSSESQGSCASS